jgi:hypothetical protein
MRGRAGRSVFAENLSDVDGRAIPRGQRMSLPQDFAQFLGLGCDFKHAIPASFWPTYCHFNSFAQACTLIQTGK